MNLTLFECCQLTFALPQPSFNGVNVSLWPRSPCPESPSNVYLELIMIRLLLRFSQQQPIELQHFNLQARQPSCLLHLRKREENFFLLLSKENEATINCSKNLNEKLETQKDLSFPLILVFFEKFFFLAFFEKREKNVWFIFKCK
jgi:hypothetical protein